jgi:IS30 family transposase
MRGIPLTFYEREQIESYLRMRKKKKWIAEKLKRDYSVIKREIKRNSGEHTPYVAKLAQEYADRRKKITNKRKLEKYENQELVNYVKEKLNENWSPEQIDGRLKSDNLELKSKDKTISYESIYKWIYDGKGRFGGFYKNLRRKQSKRIKKCSRKNRGILIKNRVSIKERPEIVDKREVFGYWETDSVIFLGKSILSVQYERKSMLARIHKCEDKTALNSELALRKSIESLPKCLWLGITRANGTENVLHYQTDVPSYFCDPYSSWQKGGVENLNGLIREYFPKRSNLDIIQENEIYLVQEKLNNRPRKKLNYLTPNEVIAKELEKEGH